MIHNILMIKVVFSLFCIVYYGKQYVIYNQIAVKY